VRQSRVMLTFFVWHEKFAKAVITLFADCLLNGFMSFPLTWFSCLLNCLYPGSLSKHLCLFSWSSLACMSNCIIIVESWVSRINNAGCFMEVTFSFMFLICLVCSFVLSLLLFFMDVFLSFSLC
jgi:hypothetical protein